MIKLASRLLGSEAIPAVSPPVSTKYFECIGVNNRTLLAEAYGARYRVFCEERGFLDTAAYPDQQETDEFDKHAIHVLARHRSGNVAGTARLILQSELGFPCQSHCKFYDAFSYLRDPESPRLANYSELSRLAVSREFRRRAGDSVYGGDRRCATEVHKAAPDDNIGEVTLPAGPEILLGILKYLYHESKRRGVAHWLIAVEKSLFLAVRRMGWPFVPIGPEVDYYGPVRPYLAAASAAEAALARRNPALLSFLRDGLSEGPRCVARSRGYMEEAEPRMRSV